MTRDKCKSCGAAIVWATSTNGKAIPVDAEPVERGNLELVHDGPTLRAIVAPRKASTGEGDLFARARPPLRYVSHFAVCPAAKEWRGNQR